MREKEFLAIMSLVWKIQEQVGNSNDLPYIHAEFSNYSRILVIRVKLNGFVYDNGEVRPDDFSAIIHMSPQGYNKKAAESTLQYLSRLLSDLESGKYDREM